MVEVIIENGDLPQKEIDMYVNRCNKKYPNCKTMRLTIVDNEFVDISYEFEDVPFERVRRIA